MLNETLDTEIYENLVKLAFQKSKPFCYSCYKEVNGMNCSGCGSDDNMRLLDGVGVEYGLCRIRHNPYYVESQIMLNLSISMTLG